MDYRRILPNDSPAERILRPRREPDVPPVSSSLFADKSYSTDASLLKRVSSLESQVEILKEQVPCTEM